MSIRFAYCLLAVAIFCGPAKLSSAASISLTPSADAFVSSTNAANNYGGAGSLEVSAAGLPKGEFQSLLQFDLSGAKASFDSIFGAGKWTLTSVAFQFTAAIPANAIFNTSAAGNIAVSWMQNDSWTEGAGTPMAPGATGITFNSLPSFLSASDQSMGSFSFNGATSGTANDSLAASAGFLADLNAGGTASLLMKAAAGDTAVSGLFNSRSFMVATSRDLLVLTAVPEPATLGIAGCTMIALVFATSRKREGESPAEPKPVARQGSAGASPSQKLRSVRTF